MADILRTEVPRTFNTEMGIESNKTLEVFTHQFIDGDMKTFVKLIAGDVYIDVGLSDTDIDTLITVLQYHQQRAFPEGYNNEKAD